jgi:hypothetical protein
MVSVVRPLLTTLTAGAIFLTLVRVALSLFCLWHLFRPSVRDAFQNNLALAAGTQPTVVVSRGRSHPAAQFLDDPVDARWFDRSVGVDTPIGRKVVPQSGAAGR